MAYAIAKQFTRDSESKADEVTRIHERWTEHGVHACRYCGAPLVIHSESECRATRLEIEREANCEHNA